MEPWLDRVPVPEYPFEVIALDMKSGLRKTAAGNDAAWVIVDKLTRRAHVIPCSVTCTSSQTARMVFDFVIRHWGLPHRIISDRDPRFIAEFWQELWQIIGTKLNMSTAEGSALKARASVDWRAPLRNSSAGTRTDHSSTGHWPAGRPDTT